jgi:hypothetical protein
LLFYLVEADSITPRPYNGAMTAPHPYSALSPDCVLDALDSIGLRGDGRLLALNSYENRVYQVGIEDDKPLVAKFYRPGRWSDAAILEEHAFTEELAAAEIRWCRRWRCTAAPCTTTGLPLCRVHPPRRPRAELGDPPCWNGPAASSAASTRWARRKPFKHRPALDIATFGTEPCEFLQANGFIPPDLKAAYASIARRRWTACAAATTAPANCRSCACTATATAATCCGPMPARTSSTSTTPAWARPSRTCG